MKNLLIFAALLSVSACTRGPTGSSDVARTPTFTVRADGSADLGFNVGDASGPHFYGEPWGKPGSLSLVIHGENIAATQLEGSVRWDATLFESETWKRGVVMEEPDLSGPGIVDYSIKVGIPGEFHFFLNRRSGNSAGDGPVVYFRLRPVKALESGSTRIDWNWVVVTNGSRSRLGCSGTNRSNCYELYGATVTIKP